MWSKAKSLFATDTVRQSTITVIASFATAGFGAVFYTLLARIMGAKDYGLVSLAITVFAVSVSIVDAGQAQGIVRFVGSNKKSDNYLPFASLALRTKLFVGFACVTVFYFLANPIAKLGFHTPELAQLLPLVGLAIASQLLVSFSLAVFQALQRFFLWGAIQVGSNLFRLSLLFGLLGVLGELTSTLVLSLHTLALFGGFVISWFWLDRRIFSTSFSQSHIKDYWSFNKWTAAFMASVALVSRLDTIFVARYLNLEQVGIYSLSTLMVAFIPQLASAIGAVTSAKFAQFTSASDAHKYLTKSILMASGIGLGVSLCMIPIALFVVNFTGSSYGPAILPFLIMLLGCIVYTATNPIRDSVLYFYKKPQFFLYLTIGQGAVIALSSILLLPPLGIVGAAIAVTLGQVFCGLVSGWYYSTLR